MSFATGSFHLLISLAYSSILPLTSHLSEWLLSKRQQTTTVVEDVEKREPSCAVWVGL